MSHRSFKTGTALMEQNITYKNHVLLVDHDNNHRTLTCGILECFSYRVTTVKLASTALSLLSRGKSQFDFLMENINSPDSCGFKLLHDAAKMDLPVVLLVDDNDVMLTMRALENGALLCINKPVTVEIVKYIWQHVLREKLSGFNENKQLTKMTTYDILQNGELHEKFTYAIEKLGEGRCYPEEILELMNVPGLTRMQVASHLQIPIMHDILKDQLNEASKSDDKESQS
ncbi:hypothetical protein BUALT_Bualt19G0049300 [Buddleja alternifolia]|uniref:Response regulatory domain-containing protein n=1 Tax=Buddleja alternifolia TaxID=168488 RepID=A0AAV6W1S5_9LAMI|nr:hypothetical protein BUALT_Bualt19G0049300 [Buddleja alternifolia]